MPAEVLLGRRGLTDEVREIGVPLAVLLLLWSVARCAVYTTLRTKLPLPLQQ